MLPGRAPPVRQLIKSHSLEPHYNKDGNSPEEIPSPKLDTKQPSEEIKNDRDKIDIGGGSNAEILHSITKVCFVSTRWQIFFSRSWEIFTRLVIARVKVIFT